MYCALLIPTTVNNRTVRAPNRFHLFTLGLLLGSSLSIGSHYIWYLSLAYIHLGGLQLLFISTLHTAVVYQHHFRRVHRARIWNFSCLANTHPLSGLVLWRYLCSHCWALKTIVWSGTLLSESLRGTKGYCLVLHTPARVFPSDPMMEHANLLLKALQ